MSKVAIIIPAINLWNKYSKPCIASVKKACEDYNLDYRILYIDNASTDETLIEAGKLVSHNFAHLRNSNPWGCAQSWNHGIKDAFERGFKYVLVINNDVLLHPQAIISLIRRFEQERDNDNSDIMMVTMHDIRSECVNPTDLFDKDRNEKKDCPESEGPHFSAFMINKRCWDMIGEFDENFRPAYFEDNDYHYRIKLQNVKAIVLPTAMFYHYGSKTIAEAGVPTSTNQTFERNREYYRTKWGGIPGEEKFKTPFNE